MVRIGAVTALAGVILASAAAQDGIQVFSPSAGSSLISDRLYTVEWTGSVAESRVAIDLYYCGDGCSAGECGDWVTSLCPYAERGCPDSQGDYNVDMPEPFASTSGEFYKIGVRFVDDAEGSGDCSDGFQLFSSEEVVVDSTVGLTVISPEAGDMAYVGEEYTLLFDYVDAFGSRVGRFSMDLHEDNGMGDCSGEAVASLCDKPDIGCKDTQGDYNVYMAYVPSGQYQIRISPFDDPSTSGCSGVFDIINGGTSMDDDDDFSLSYGF